MAQQPIIPPVVIEEFTCAGNGLLYEGHPRESPAELRLLLLPSGDKNGISDRDRPKTWWLAQNKFYGLAQAKATPIGTLRSKLEDGLRSTGGMKIPERLLDLEAEGNKKYRELHQLVHQETQPPQKGSSKAGKPTKLTMPPTASSSKQSNPKLPKAVASSSKPNNSSKPPAARKPSTKGGVLAGASTPSGGVAPQLRSVALGSTKVTARKTILGKLPRPMMPETENTALDRPDDFSGHPLRPTKQTAKKTTGGLEPRKRGRSPGDSVAGPSRKRLQADDDTMEFAYLVGTYRISAPEISNGWAFPCGFFQLVITLDSEGRIFGSFHFGICSGILRSTVGIEPRADGASAAFEWCGQEEYGNDQVHPPKERMKGVLRFTRRKRDGNHTVKGVMEDIPALGKCEFTGVKMGDALPIYRKWEDFNWAAYDAANKAR